MTTHSSDEAFNLQVLEAVDIPGDVRQFAVDVLSGDLYEHLRDVYARRRRVKRFTRSQAKEKFFMGIFSEPRKEGLMSRIVHDRYGSVAAVLDDLKVKDYKRPSMALQRMESWAMLGLIVRQIMDEHPGIPVVTLHDSILTTPQHLDTVERIMRGNLRGLGLVPRLRREPARPT